jgi:ammonia channel protein AmtB
MNALYHITGGFQTTGHGETTIRYVVSGQVGIPLMHAAFQIGLLAIVTLMLVALAFSPDMAGNRTVPLLALFMLITTAVYTWFAYRSYQKHLKELNSFMEDFARHMGIKPTISMMPS